MADTKRLPSFIAVTVLIAVIIGVIIAAVLTNKQDIKPVSNDSIPSFSLGIGQEYAYPKGDKKRIRIKSADKGIVSADRNGTLTAAALGQTTITVKGQKLEVHVIEAPSVLEFAVPNLSVGVGEVISLRADVPERLNLAGIKYEVSDDSVISLSGGKLTALAAGKATVTAETYNGIKAVCQVSIAPAPESISYNGDITICVGRSKELRPLLPEGCAAHTITYASSNTDIVKIEPGGNATAVAEGEADITATAYNGVSAVCHVTVETIPYYIRPNLDADKPMIALTFDDGPNKSTTSIILDALKQYNGSATFFIVGNRLLSSGNAECARRMVEQGCQLGNHTYDHSHYGNKVTEEDIVNGINAVEEAAGHKPSAFRPTGGAMTDFIGSHSQAPIYIWSVDTLDWKYRNEQRIYDVLTNDAGDGDIVLMHDIYETTAQAVARAIPVLVENGFQIVNAAELSYYKGYDVENGEVYYSFK